MRMPNIGLGVASFIIPAARGRLECRRGSWGIAPLRDRVDVSRPAAEENAQKQPHRRVPMALPQEGEAKAGD